MAHRERFLSSEQEKKRKLLFNRFSHVLSSRILTQEGKTPLTADIPEPTLVAFQEKSARDRNNFWNTVQSETGQKLSFGQQMAMWLGLEESTPGMYQWITQQKDPTVMHMLQDVGLFASHEQTSRDMQDPKVVKFIQAIQVDLHNNGDYPLSDDALTDPTIARSLIFYTKYLHVTPDDRTTNLTQNLIDTLVHAATSQASRDTTATKDNLQKLAPLFALAGLEGQYALAALTVAKVDAKNKDALEKVTPADLLNEDEARALAFLKNSEKIDLLPNQLQSHESYDIQQVFSLLQPQPTPGHPYWIRRQIPKDFAQNIPLGDLTNLQLTQPFWNDDGSVNKEVFDAEYVLAGDKRFRNAQFLTHNDSGLLALAAASAESPEEQMQVYKQLSEAVLLAHGANPRLLDEFLKGQNAASLYKFASNDVNKAEIIIAQKLEPVEKAFQNEFQQKYPDVNIFDLNDIHAKLTPEQLREESEKRFLRKLAVQQEVMSSLDNYSGLVITEKVFSDQQVPVDIVNIPTTVDAWQGRVQNLMEAVRKDPLILTPEQISQVEFLSHSVNTKKVMELLQAEQVVENSASPEVSRPVLGRDSMTAHQLFSLFEGTIGQGERRPGMVLPNIAGFKEFPTDGKKIEDFLNLTPDGDKFDVPNLIEENGKVKFEFNMQNFFYNEMLQENSVTKYALDGFINTEGVTTYGPNTLLAYVLEAAPTSELQETLLKKLFTQVSNMYVDHPQLRTMALESEEKYSRRTESISPLFESKEAMSNRLEELVTKLNNREVLSVRDYLDMGIYALPFNLINITKQMVRQ